LANCLEELLESYTVLNEIFVERKLDKTRLQTRNVFLLERIIEFLKPWKHVSTRLQATNIPSIHVVTSSIETLKTSLEWMSCDTKLIHKKGRNYLYL
jgi:hypothetical protein